MYGSLLANVSPDRKIKETIEQFPQHTQSYYLENKPVGLMTCWQNAFHPYSLNFAGYLEPRLTSGEQMQVYEQILTDLTAKAQKNHQNALITYDYAPQLLFNAIGQKNGFKLIRTTVEPQMPLKRALKNILIDTDLQMVTLHEIKKDSVIMNRLAQVSFSDYQKNHLANPVAKIPLSEWSKTIFTDQLEHAPLALITAGQIKAYCFSFEDTSQELTLGWMGAVKPNLLDQLQQQLLNWAQAKYQTLSGEFDSTDALATRTYRKYAFNLCPVYETYLKKLD